VEELRRRLLAKGFEARDVSYCLAWLEERNLLDDIAFAQALTRDRLRFSPRSPSMLRRELALKGIDPSVAGRAVEAVLEEEGASERNLAARAAEAWIRKQSPETLRDLLAPPFTPRRERARRRFHGFLTRRGFRGEAARAGMESGIVEARKIIIYND